MSDHVFAPPAAPSLPVAESQTLFPVRRVYCIGRNYAAHAVEMGGDPDREPPFFFQKNPDNLDPSGRFPYPPESLDVHHEVELAVMLGSGGTDIPVEEAMAHVWGYALALDMTRRDLQGEAKKAAGRGRWAKPSNGPPRWVRCIPQRGSAIPKRGGSSSVSMARCGRRAISTR